MQCELLADYNVKSFGDVFEKIYIEHNGQVPMQYGLNASAKELFFKCSKPIEDAPLSQGAATGGSIVCATNSKKIKNTLRMALNMDVLYHRLSKVLALESGPTPLQINASTMQMAIALVEALETIKGISEIVSSAPSLNFTLQCNYCFVNQSFKISLLRICPGSWYAHTPPPHRAFLV